MTCPLERQIAALLDAAKVSYTRPERDPADPANLDFYLPEFNIYIEVKASHADRGRLERQLERVPIAKRNIMVLMGRTAVEEFINLISACSKVDLEKLSAR